MNLELLAVLAPLAATLLLILSNRTRYRSEINGDREMMKQRDETIVALHFCHETVEKLEGEVAGLRWLVSTYGIRAPTRVRAPVQERDEQPDEQVNRHISAALAQERINLAFLQEQTARYGDSDLTRHNQIEATAKRIQELETMLDAHYAAAAAA